jgi:hypothetical protein
MSAIDWTRVETERRDSRKGGNEGSTGIGKFTGTSKERRTLEKVHTNATGISLARKCKVCGFGSPTAICFGCKTRGHK